jgi:hypothetical protein
MTEAVEPAEEPIAIVLTHTWGLQVLRRLSDLEQGRVDVGVAQLPPELEQTLLEALRKLDDRQTRHREELEQIKEAMRRLVEYVMQNTPASSPARTEGSPL